MTEERKTRILIVDNDPATVSALVDFLADAGYEADIVDSGLIAIERLAAHPYDLLLSSLTLPDMDGVTLLGRATDLDPYLVGILMTDQPSVESAVEAMKAGAADYVLKPIRQGTLLPALDRAVKLRRLRMENLELRDTIAIHELNQALAHTLAPDDLLNRIVDASMAQFEADEVSVMVLDEDGLLLRAVAAGGERRERVLGITVPVGQGIAGHVASSREPLVLHGDLTGDALTPMHQRSGVQSALSVPMIARGDLIGVLNITYTSKARTITAAQTRVLSIFANAAAAGIHAARMHEAQRRLDRRYGEVLAMADDAIISLDQSERIVVFSPGAERMFGYEASEVAGHAIDLVLPPELMDETVSHERWEHRSVDRLRVLSERARLIGRRRDGTLLHVEVRISAPTEQSEILCTAIVRDVSERVDHEERIARLNDELNQAQRMETLGRFAGGVAHDFNNLLTAIIGGCELVRDELDPDSAAGAEIREIENAGRRASNLTRQLLAFSRRQIVSPQAIDVNDALRSLEGVLRRVVREDIEIEYRLSDSLWPVCMDAPQLDQIILNLAVNAHDAMPDGGSLTFRTSNAVVQADEYPEYESLLPGDYVRISVSDTGHGMDGETIEHAFEPFFTTKSEGKGTGLGLASVHGILTQNDGSIHIDSERGRGTTFVIYLPRHRGKVAASPVAAAPAMPGGSETILFVDDDDHVRRVTARLLRRLGYQVLEADRPSAAIELCRKHDGKIALLISDMVMPEMNGFAVAERIRALRPDIRTLFMSGYAPDAMRHGAIMGPGMHHIEKPYEIDAFAKAVRKAVESKAAAA